MLIHCPMNPEYEAHLEELVDLGADEFYMGYTNNLRDSLSIVSLRLSPHSNFPSLEDAARAVRRIKTLDRRVYITVNGPFYPEEFLDTIVSDVEALSREGADGFIISDINLFLRLRESMPELYMIASSGTHVLNSKTIEFMRSLGARRCILPRQLAIPEIRAILSNFPDMDFEIFVLNEECYFLDGHCNYSHYGELDYRPACNELFSAHAALHAARTEMWSCGLCALFHLRDFDRLSLKICGRSLRYGPIRNNVECLGKVLGELDEYSDAGEFEARCRRLYERIHGSPCGKKCYYDTAAVPGTGLQAGR